MTVGEAIRILDPETTAEALAEIEYYAGFSGQVAKVNAVSDACEVAVAAMRKVEKFRWVPVTERLPQRVETPPDVLVWHSLGGVMRVDRAWYSYDLNRWCSALGMNLKVTHWMPMPEPPKEETK